MQPFRSTRLRFALLPCLLALGTSALASAQISLSTAVNLALRNSPKVKVAQSDIDRARAILAQSKEAFVPAVSANGGVGKSSGAPLGPPIVFSLTAQSLIFNSSQFDYIHAARLGLESAQMALDAVRSDVAEDATSTYVALDNALQRRAVQGQALNFSRQLVSITEDRFNAGVDPHIELTKAKHTEAQIRLQSLLLDDEIADQAGHLARLTGLSGQGLTTEHDSVPALQPPSDQPAPPAAKSAQTVGISAAFAAARAKQYTAQGQKRYLFLPQVAFSANYSRIATAFTNYTQYYPYFGQKGNSFNSLNVGVEITVPILDMVHRARYREALADAAHALHDAEAQQMLFADSQDKLRRSTAELAARRDLAGLDQELAQDQLNAVLVRLQAPSGAVGGEQMTPKDEQNARLQERLRTLDMLSADLQLRQAEISLLRQQGGLTNWLAATVPSAANGPSAAPVPPSPATIGMPPGDANPSGTQIPSVPTTGTPPATQPAGPVTTPAPTAPPTAPSATPHV